MPAKETAYCVKCKSKREMKNVVNKTSSNGRSMHSGECVKCGTKMNKFVKK